MKKSIVFIDFESWFETPYRESFDLRNSTDKILKILDKYNVKGVFNTCGIIARNFPDIIKKISRGGHEIASHGYAHENLIQMSSYQLNKILGQTEKAIQNVIGEKPIGIRSPWLFSSNRLYKILEKRGYRWVSNRFMMRSEILNSPQSKDFIPFFGSLPTKIMLRTMEIFFSKSPYKINKLIEIPLLSSMDGDLLQQFNPNQESDAKWLKFALNSLIKQYERSKGYFNLNFHDWIIGTSNRIVLLDKILSYLIKKDIRFMLARDMVI